MSSSAKQRRRGGRRRTGEILNDSNNSPPLQLPSSSASLIGSNVDILTLILTRVPSKSLLVFKCVSKQWLSMINDPQFVRKHFTKNPRFSIPGLFWGCDLDSVRKPVYDYIFLDGNTNSYVPFKTLAFKIRRLLRADIKILQSCNGLLLCSNCVMQNHDRTYYIYNPFTKQYKILPPSQVRSRDFGYLVNVSLAFDPSKSPYYKVVSFWRNMDREFRIEIYDSETSCSRLSGFDSCTSQAKYILWGRDAGIFWNGSLYWCDRKGSMAYFDVDRESVGVVPLPISAPTIGCTNPFSIAEYGGHFYFIEGNWFDRRLSIFEMDSADSSWKAKGQVDGRLNPYAGSPCGSTYMPYKDYIIFIMESEEEESTKVVMLTKESRIVSYNLKDRSFEKIYDLSAQQDFSFSARFLYIESLACV